MNLSDIQVELSHPLKKFAGWTIYYNDSADDFDDKVRRICHPNLKSVEQEEPFEGTIFKLENKK